MTRLCDALTVPKGVTGVVGGGGKTSLIDRLCDELKDDGKVLRLTTAHCWLPEGFVLLSPTPQTLAEAFKRHRVVAVGELNMAGKLQQPKGELVPLFELADYVLIEADGSKGLPLKAPAHHEPALCGLEGLVIAVAGMTGLQQPIGQAAHRPERYAALTGKELADTATPQDAAKVLQSPMGQRKNVHSAYTVLLNQCDTPERLALGRACGSALRSPCVLAALQARPGWLEQWREKEC